MDDLDAFRADARQWIDRHAPEVLRGKLTDPDHQVWGGTKEQRTPAQQAWLAACVERGFTAPTWPETYGGGGLTKAQAKIVDAEMRRIQVPPPLIGFGLTMIGPTLLEFGTDAQKARHLPPIVRGEIRWCQGYSEPNAGSDLASLQCDAADMGDHYVLNGQKTWTSYGDKADWMFLLVRTNRTVKKQAGITFLLMDVNAPGVRIAPIRLISGSSPFCESFFENVRVPKENVIGQVDGGWTVAKALLGHERSMIADLFGSAQRSRGADAVVAVAREYAGDASGRIADPLLRDRVAALLHDQICFQLTVQRAADNARAGHRPGPESSLFKIYGTELNQRRQDLLCALRGAQCLGWEGEGFTEDELAQTREWLRSRGNTIEGGTSEIQLNIIAKQVLGLPD
jgi:alkylation response protein AidB-like acyl-CoA dehydrogenase